MDNNNGSLIHILTNIRSNASLFNTNNVSINYKTYSFNNDYLLISRNVDKVCPEYIILDLFDNNIELNVIFNYIKDVYIIFKIGEQNIIEFPLKLLWNLQEPEIVENKLYIYFPFKNFFGNIFLYNLLYEEANFILVNFNRLANCVRRCNLLCKIFVYGNLNQINDVSQNVIQQISSLELMASNNDNTQEANEFVIRTNMFEGLVRGFFIEATNIDELIEFQFFINGNIRTNYDRFLIRNKCFKINDNLLFYPFNDELLYQNSSINMYDGAFYMSNNIVTNMRLKFNNQHNCVKIYALIMNIYTQENGLGRLRQNINICHLKQDLGLHPLMTQDQIISQNIPSSIYFNNITTYTTTYTSTHANISTTSNTNNYGSYTIGYYENSYNINEINEIQTIGKIIPEGKNTCGISLDEIVLNDNYMSCTNCTNNFKVNEIRRWHQSSRTCPSCRSNWRDFNVYISI